MKFELQHEEDFKTKNRQTDCVAHMAQGSLLVKERYRFSDEDAVAEITMNPYPQYFIGLQDFQYETSFDPSMMAWFRQRKTPEMLEWADIGRLASSDDDTPSGSSGGNEDDNKGDVILDATCAPQKIRLPTEVSLLKEARENARKITDILHKTAIQTARSPEHTGW